MPARTEAGESGGGMIAEEGKEGARSILERGGWTPTPHPFSVSADSKGVTECDFVSADSKELSERRGETSEVD